MPAMLRIASTFPNASCAAANIASTSSAREMSTENGTTASPSSAAVSFSRPLMSAARTRAPSRTNTSAVARAIPDPAPVMTATLPSSSPTSGPPEPDRKSLPPADGRRRGEADVVVVDLPVRPPLEDLLHRDPALEPGERGTQAVVAAEPEDEVLAVLAVDVVLVRVLVAALVPRCCARDEQDRAAGGDLHAVVLDVLREPARRVRAGRLVAQRLVHGSRDERRVLPQLTPRVRVLTQDLADPADEAAGRLVAGAGDDLRVRQDLLPRQAPLLSLVVLVLRVQELRHQVVGRVLHPPVDVLLERLALEQLVGVGLHRLTGHRAQVLVHPVADGGLVGLRDPEQHADHPHRHLPAEVLDEVEGLGADERVEGPGAVQP